LDDNPHGERESLRSNSSPGTVFQNHQPVNSGDLEIRMKPNDSMSHVSDYRASLSPPYVNRFNASKLGGHRDLERWMTHSTAFRADALIRRRNSEPATALRFQHLESCIRSQSAECLHLQAAERIEDEKKSLHENSSPSVERRLGETFPDVTDTQTAVPDCLKRLSVDLELMRLTFRDSPDDSTVDSASETESLSFDESDQLFEALLTPEPSNFDYYNPV
jgi:hypothetical protein